MRTILKTIVGSQAHGLAGPDSDFDYRGVFVVPSSELLKLGGSVSHTSWDEGKVDDTQWEIGKFLLMATKSNNPKHELFVPAIPNKGDCIRIKEKGNELTNPYVVTGIVFFEKDDKKCSVCVLVKSPDAP